MSIIGEIYEEQIWEANKKLQDFLVYLEKLLDSEDTDVNMHAYNITKEFKKRFKEELSQSKY